jgi:Protein of unknown function (DUF2892)
MKTNVGGIDRILRVTAGLALLALFFLAEGNIRWFGLIGFVPLLTGLFAFCPVYPMLGINTCPVAAKRQG